jgi:hypothetical protein
LEEDGHEINGRQSVSVRWARSEDVRLTAVTLVALLAASVGQAWGGSPKARSAAVYNLLANPHAAFLWFPASPHPGEAVLLASISTDPTSPINGYAWDLGQGAGFVAGGPALSTTFSTYAPRVVRLRVTNGNALSDVAAETIHMSAPPATVLQPFPIVRIVGIVRSSGVRIKLLAVQAGAGARSTVTCRRRGCPVKYETRVVPSTRRAAIWVRFHRFERFLRAGVVLEIRVSKAEKIGSYTRFAIRRRRLPARVDECLDPSGVTPMTCPSS